MPNRRAAEGQKTNLDQRPRGIIRIAALWVLCRYRHKTHWSGGEARLNREFGKRFGDEKYAAEELVAELASAILGSELVLPVDHLDDHASYIANWLRILKADPKALLTIASKADEAANYLLRLGGREPLPDEAESFEAGANDPELPAAPASIAA